MDKIIMDQLMKSGSLIQDGMGQLPQDLELMDLSTHLFAFGQGTGMKRVRRKKDDKMARLQARNVQMEQVIASLQKELEVSKAKELGTTPKTAYFFMSAAAVLTAANLVIAVFLQ